MSVSLSDNTNCCENHALWFTRPIEHMNVSASNVKISKQIASHVDQTWIYLLLNLLLKLFLLFFTSGRILISEDIFLMLMSPLHCHLIHIKTQRAKKHPSHQYEAYTRGQTTHMLTGILFNYGLRRDLTETNEIVTELSLSGLRWSKPFEKGIEQELERLRKSDVWRERSTVN